MIMNVLVLLWTQNIVMIHFHHPSFLLKFVSNCYFQKYIIVKFQIADFLLLLVCAAIHSHRHELILDPYPKLINPYNTSTTLLDENGDVK